VLEVLLEVVVPVFLVAIVGGVAGRRLGLDARTFSRAVLFLFSPALVFTSLSTVEIPGGDLAGVVGVTAGVFVFHTAAGLAWARLRREDRATESATVLAASMANQGNLGLPIASLAFGPAGFDVAVVIYVTGVVLWSSIGIAVASLGHGSMRAAALAPLRYPACYAAALGAAVNVADIDLPAVVAVPVSTLADAAIPTMLVVLGLQFSVPKLGGLVAPVGVSALRLVAGPLAALVLVGVVGLTGVAADATVVLAGMPTAVMAIVVTGELRGRVDVVARTVVLSTILSGATLAVWISLVR
jgi:hypothetical protein